MSQSPTTYRGTVYPWQCDHVGHMNVMWYVGKFDEATWQFFNLLGLTPSFLRRAKRGMAAVVAYFLTCRNCIQAMSSRYGPRFLKYKEKSLRFVHEMTNDESNEVVARTTLKAVHTDTEARRSCAFPESIATKAASILASSERQ